MVIFSTQRTNCFLLQENHASALKNYYSTNAEHLAPWEPKRSVGYHSMAAWKQRVVDYCKEQERGTARRILAYASDTEELIGVCNFTNIVYGSFQACNLGYSIAHSHAGKGLMTEIVGASLNDLFETLDLHRAMANYMPENAQSARVLEKLGFEEEGLARSYLHINGQWRDHVLTSKRNPRHDG